MGLGDRAVVGLRKTLFAAVVSGTVLGLLELGARMLPLPTRVAQGTAMVPHPTRIWALEPGPQTSFAVEVQINELGLRETAVQVASPERRILTLGDSSIFGHAIKDGMTLHDQIAKKLLDRGAPSEVICGGVPGYSTAQSLVLLEEVGWGLEPDLLVIGNQFSDMNRDQFSDAEVLERLGSPAVQLEFLVGKSQLFRRVRSMVAQAKGIPTYAVVGWPNPNSEGEIRVPPADYVANLETMLVQARANGVGVIFLQLAEPSPEEGPEKRAYADMMEQVSRVWGVPVIRAPYIFEVSGLPEDRLFLDEVHPSALGNELMAQALVETLLQGKFPDSLPMVAPQPKGEVQIRAYHGPPPMLSQQELFLNQR